MAVNIIKGAKKINGRTPYYFSFYFEGKRIKKTTWNKEPMLSKSQAIACENECKQQLIHERDKAFGKITLYELYDEFVRTTKSNLKASALNRYTIFRKNYLTLTKDKYIHELTPNDILAWKNSIIELGATTEYINRTLAIVKQVLNYGQLMYNLKGQLQLPLLEKVKDNSVVEREKEKNLPQDKFEYMMTFLNLDSDTDFHYYVVFNVMYYAGLRIGEVAALNINDVEDNKILITKDYVRIGGVDYIQAPKSKNSVRIVVLDERTSELINQYIDRFKPTDILFRRDGKYLNQQKTRRVLTRIAQASELDLEYDIHPHSLRHSHASQLRELGFDVFAIAKRLGHEPEISATTYIHSNDAEQAEMVKKINK